MNLFEGNVPVRQGADFYWGSGSHLVMFRNWHRLETNDPTAIRDMIAIDIEAWNQYYSAIGNVLGHDGMWGNYEIQGPENGVYDTGDGRAFCWKIGFFAEVGYVRQLRQAFRLVLKLDTSAIFCIITRWPL
jgi:hypothetical protein